MEKFENETSLPPAPIPKTDTAIKQEISMKEVRLITVENKENFIDGNLPLRTVPPCRPKNDVTEFDLFII